MTHGGRGSWRRAGGFTLFEVVVSMLVLSVAILATLALLPMGLKAQQLSRYQVFASAQALTLMENFHSPLISFRGHGILAPAMDTNLANTSAGVANVMAPPVPGWANRLRDVNLLASPYQHDIERYLCGWVTGVAPLPLQIARRLDSDGDEIQRHLDAGGYLYYVDTSYVRGLTVAAARDKALALNPTPESQKIVFAVTGYAQQNALTSPALESWPWYELYPFPPAWVALKASGYELRRGPVSKMATRDATGTWTYGDPVEGTDLETSHVTPYRPAGSPKWRDGIFWGDGGHSAWAPVTFPRAPMNDAQIQWFKQPPAGAPDQTLNRIDPLDPKAATKESVGWYQGRDWRYFAQTYGAGTPWAVGWQAFQRLAGFNDAYRDLAFKDYGDYAQVPLEQHYERAGWLPVMAMLVNAGSARYDHYWYSLAAGAYAGGSGIGTEDDDGHGAFPPLPPNATGAGYPTPWLTSGQQKVDNRHHTSVPSSQLMPTYEMRASYRDKALELWYAVAGGIPAFAAKPAIGTPQPVIDTQTDCDEYEYGPAALSAFTASAEPLLDPHALGAGDFPPHPAQVLALSYLAHAAMMMTGWDPPFLARSDPTVPSGGQILDWDCLAWHYAVMDANGDPVRDPSGGVAERAKDAKALAADAAAGAGSIQMTNDSPDRRIVLYRGDELCFEQDYREWYDYSQPRPLYPEPKGVVRYRVVRDVTIDMGATKSVQLEPPLRHDYKSLIGARPADTSFIPGYAAVPDHQAQIIRICNDYDRAFARTVHEMCMRWAASYASENPYDWGAPRMMNHQVMSDKPLALLDLFEDAAVGASSDGVAQRAPRNAPTAARISPSESFYRWVQPPNTAPRSWYRQGMTPSSGPICAISSQGPGRNPQTAWLSLAYNAQLAPPSTTNPAGAWDWTSDANRYWLDRRFQPFHRGRQLVFWAVDWRSYEDAETAPTAPLDLAKHMRSILPKADGTTVDWFLPALTPDANPSSRSDSQFAGNPENALLWTDSDRRRRYMDGMTAASYGIPAFWTYTRERSDIVLGHWGADRNNNRALDIGPVPKSTRMRALSVARFNVYDPILRLHDSD